MINKTVVDTSNLRNIAYTSVFLWSFSKSQRYWINILKKCKSQKIHEYINTFL